MPVTEITEVSVITAVAYVYHRWHSTRSLMVRRIRFSTSTAGRIVAHSVFVVTVCGTFCLLHMHRHRLGRRT